MCGCQTGDPPHLARVFNPSTSFELHLWSRALTRHCWSIDILLVHLLMWLPVICGLRCLIVSALKNFGVVFALVYAPTIKQDINRIWQLEQIKLNLTLDISIYS